MGIEDEIATLCPHGVATFSNRGLWNYLVDRIEKAEDALMHSNAEAENYRALYRAEKEKHRWHKWPEERPGNDLLDEGEYWTAMDDRAVDINYWDGTKWEWDNVTHWREIVGPEEELVCDKIRRRLTAHARIAEKADSYANLILEARELVSRCDPACLDWLERSYEALEPEPHINGKLTKGIK